MDSRSGDAPNPPHCLISKLSGAFKQKCCADRLVHREMYVTRRDANSRTGLPQQARHSSYEMVEHL